MNSVPGPVHVASGTPFEAEDCIRTHVGNQAVHVPGEGKRPQPARPRGSADLESVHGTPGMDQLRLPVTAEAMGIIRRHLLGTSGTSRLAPQHKQPPLFHLHGNEGKNLRLFKRKVRDSRLAVRTFL